MGLLNPRRQGRRCNVFELAGRGGNWRASEASETLLVVVKRDTYIHIARCQVVVKFYRDLYFGYSPQYRSCGE